MFNENNNNRLNVVICWHMHQPEYRAGNRGEYQQPWTYLHAIKDYVDMAAHLENQPQGRAVVNFAPTLLEQLQDYTQQMHAFLQNGEGLRDPFLNALITPALPVETEQRLSLIKACLRANKGRIIDRFPAFRRLAEIADWLQHNIDAVRYLNHQFLVDILMWYHLAWLGETVRRTNPNVQRLMSKGHSFTLHERRELFEIIYELTCSVIPRFKSLAEKGQIELSMTPYAHPIIPLLLDIESAKEAVPNVPLPKYKKYDGGEMRVRWHIQTGLEVFEKCFGIKPKGCWPSEGGVSDATVRILESEKFQWVASGENVLCHSFHHAQTDQLSAHQAFHLQNSEIACFFRDDKLSDLIGFEYTKWHADDAVANLINQLEDIARSHFDPQQKVVSLILDGENAWEYYPENGFYFLSVLYQRLAASPYLKLTTFSECLKQPVPKATLPMLVAGSWVYGTFSTWIGDRDKNRGWEMLIEAKRAFDKTIDKLGMKNRAAAERQLAICEGSDWFWWFGDYNPSHSVSDFERLFRLQLATLYHLLGVEPPDYLGCAFTHGGGAPESGGVMRRN
jgi:alpha-amylase/alpha-mannosidase (GH57 family)